MDQPEKSDAPALAPVKPRVSIFDPELSDRNADEVILSRMRQHQDPTMFFPPMAAVDLVVGIIKAKIDWAMQILREKEKGDVREELEDAAHWVLEIAELDHTPDQVADVLQQVARARIETISKFSHKRGPRPKTGPKPKPIDPNAPPKR